MNLNGLEDRLVALEREVADLKAALSKGGVNPCRHEWILNRRGDGPAVMFSGTNSYIQCTKCGKREKV